jgi:Protein of unknown function (DUF1194)
MPDRGAVRVAATAVALALMAPAAVLAADEPVDLELVLAVDISGSVDEVEASLQRQGYVAALADPRVVEAVQFGPLGRIAVTYVEWAGAPHQRTVVDWMLVEDQAGAGALSAAVAEAPMTIGRWTSISGAIDYSAALFDDNGFEGTRKVIDISGDGYNNSGRPPMTARDEAVARGITINGLPIMNDRPNPWGSPPPADLDLYYERFVIGGPGAFTLVAQDFETFGAAILNKLILEIAGLTPDDREAWTAPTDPPEADGGS